MTIENDDWALLRRRAKHRSSSALAKSEHAVGWRTIALALLALFLIWEVVTRSFAAYLADANPGLAVLLKSNQSYRTFEPRH